MAQSELKVLLIEDDEVDREQVQRTLASKYKLQTASTGYSGLEAARSNTPDVVLLDYRLPDIDGTDIISTLLDLELPVILLTIEEDPEIIIEAMKQGAYDYVVKRRMSSTALEHAIVSAVEKRNLKQSVEEKQIKLAVQAATLEKQNQQIRDLASALMLAQQQERRQIAQTLHDDLQQLLHSIQVRTLLINSDLPPPQQANVETHIDEMENLIDKALEIIRTLSVELSPPLLGGEGLDEVFAWLASQKKRRYGLKVRLEGKEDSYVDNDDLRVLIFQMVRELLFNVVKHAAVNEARLKYSTDSEFIHVQVIDHGVGFDKTLIDNAKDKTAFGLTNIRERLNLLGGNLKIETRPGVGTTVAIKIPQQPPQFR